MKFLLFLAMYMAACELALFRVLTRICMMNLQEVAVYCIPFHFCSLWFFLDIIRNATGQMSTIFVDTNFFQTIMTAENYTIKTRNYNMIPFILKSQDAIVFMLVQFGMRHWERSMLVFAFMFYVRYLYSIFAIYCCSEVLIICNQ